MAAEIHRYLMQVVVPFVNFRTLSDALEYAQYVFTCNFKGPLTMSEEHSKDN